MNKAEIVFEKKAGSLAVLKNLRNALKLQYKGKMTVGSEGVKKFNILSAKIKNLSQKKALSIRFGIK
ncbi:hypothetical protein LCGC14_1639760 [marine sediment metagenome]|uniref:Uncharacterized protein n=1 Tax=marine sediment metagenome TaxID=412755 RepID=A0A0F9IMJ9_9ZZZZ